MKSLKLILLLALAVGVAVVIRAWVEARRDSQALKETIATQNKILDAANADKAKNDSNLHAALARIDSLKRLAKTPSAALQGLNQSLPLPQPLTSVAVEEARAATLDSAGSAASAAATRASSSVSVQNAGENSSVKTSATDGAATIPAVDLIPLYRYTQDCRACSLELRAARTNALEDQKKLMALTAQRDAAVKASRGGDMLRRVKQAAIWFGVGAGVGCALAIQRGHIR